MLVLSLHLEQEGRVRWTERVTTSCRDQSVSWHGLAIAESKWSGFASSNIF